MQEREAQNLYPNVVPHSKQISTQKSFGYMTSMHFEQTEVQLLKDKQIINTSVRTIEEQDFLAKLNKKTSLIDCKDIEMQDANSDGNIISMKKLISNKMNMILRSKTSQKKQRGINVSENQQGISLLHAQSQMRTVYNKIRVQVLVKMFLNNMISLLPKYQWSIFSQCKQLFLVVNDKSASFTKQEEHKSQIKQNLQIQHTKLQSIKQSSQVFIIPEKLLKRLPLFSPFSLFIIIWDYFQLIFLSFFFILIPIHISFNKQISEIEGTNSIHIVFLIFLYLDVPINFNTSLLQQGREIKSRSLITSFYIKNGLFWDVITLLSLTFFLILDPYHTVFEVRILINIILLFFLKRSQQFGRVLRKIEIQYHFSPQISSILRLAILFLMNIYIIHLLSCIWIYIARVQEDTEDSPTWITKFNLNEKPWYIQFLNSFYLNTVTMVTVGYGDISPQTSIERICSILTVLSACGVFAYSISEVGSIFSEMNEEQKRLNSNMFIINNYMKKKKITSDLQYQVRHYLEYYWQESLSENTAIEQNIINQLSNNLKENLIIEANRLFVLESPFFRDNFSLKTILKTVSIVQEQRCTPEEIIYLEGDIDDSSIYFIEKGSVQFFNANSLNDSKSHPLNYLKQGDHFGEFCFLTGKQREKCMRSVEFTTLIKIERNKFLEILNENPQDFEKFCLIRDDMVLNENYNHFQKICRYCQVSSQVNCNHREQVCPLVNFIPNRQKLEDQFRYQPITQSRQKQERNGGKFNAKGRILLVEEDQNHFIVNLKLLIKQYISKNGFDDYNSDQEDEEMQGTQDQFTSGTSSSSESQISENQRRKSTQMKVTYGQDKRNSSYYQNKYQFQSMNETQPLQYSPIEYQPKGNKVSFCKPQKNLPNLAIEEELTQQDSTNKSNYYFDSLNPFEQKIKFQCSNNDLSKGSQTKKEISYCNINDLSKGSETKKEIQQDNNHYGSKISQKNGSSTSILKDWSTHNIDQGCEEKINPQRLKNNFIETKIENSLNQQYNKIIHPQKLMKRESTCVQGKDHCQYEEEQNESMEELRSQNMKSQKEFKEQQFISPQTKVIKGILKHPTEEVENSQKKTTLNNIKDFRDENNKEIDIIDLCINSSTLDEDMIEPKIKSQNELKGHKQNLIPCFQEKRARSNQQISHVETKKFDHQNQSLSIGSKKFSQASPFDDDTNKISSNISLKSGVFFMQQSQQTNSFFSEEMNSSINRKKYMNRSITDNFSTNSKILKLSKQKSLPLIQKSKKSFLNHIPLKNQSINESKRSSKNQSEVQFILDEKLDEFLSKRKSIKLSKDSSTDNSSQEIAPQLQILIQNIQSLQEAFITQNEQRKEMEITCDEKDGIVFDKMKMFEIYFPHNNYELVLQTINSKPSASNQARLWKIRREALDQRFSQSHQNFKNSQNFDSNGSGVLNGVFSSNSLNRLKYLKNSNIRGSQFTPQSQLETISDSPQSRKVSLSEKLPKQKLEEDSSSNPFLPNKQGKIVYAIEQLIPGTNHKIRIPNYFGIGDNENLIAPISQRAKSKFSKKNSISQKDSNSDNENKSEPSQPEQLTQKE